MASLIACREIAKSYWDRPLFAGISLSVSAGDRIGVIGANGSGKTTLLRILAGLESPDEGECAVAKGLRVGFVPQDSRFAAGRTVAEILREAAERDAAPHQDGENDPRVRAGIILSRLGFGDPAAVIDTLSGGWRKRLSLAQALVTDPDILLLDEPTNHLDLDGILWLENLLVESRFAYVIVSHDRAFLQRCVCRTLELDRRYPGGFLSVEGDYSTFLERREEMLIARARQQESLSVKVRNEVAWLRSGVKARGTKAQFRIDEAHQLIRELETMKQQGVTGRAGIDFVATGRKTKRLLEASGLGKSLGGRRLLGDFDLLLRPGLRLGLLGANGSGKTTLLRLLAGELEPDEGRIQRVEQLRMVYFDQHREELDPNLTLRRALAEKGDTVIFRDRPIHVGSWAARFRFPASQLDVEIGRLSGGERAKILIARLMLRPADVLLLDEPTNDLDIPTLEVLEESLTDFPGALVMVTHDRYLLDRISTVLLELDGEGGTKYFADYAQAEADRAARRSAAKPKKTSEPPKVRPRPAPTKLSFREQREFDGLEAAILQAEAEVEKHRREMEDPAVNTNAQRLQQAFEAHRAAHDALEALYARWYELETKRAALQAQKDR
ncbi:MAG: ABC-F family ATP-binding cassette domain-containing protein [Myxococcales bacterium]|nr:ABC-F family ATP-binding cassette domain-containing protein [Myxococcales bacterium]